MTCNVFGGTLLYLSYVLALCWSAAYLFSAITCRERSSSVLIHEYTHGMCVSHIAEPMLWSVINAKQMLQSAILSPWDFYVIVFYLLASCKLLPERSKQAHFSNLFFLHSLHLSAQLNVSTSVISTNLHRFLRTGIVSLTFVLLTFLFYFLFAVFFQTFTALHWMPTRSSDENSVCLSVTRVNCDKTVERSVQIYIPHERTLA